jgi:hypothetical protein
MERTFVNKFLKKLNKGLLQQGYEVYEAPFNEANTKQQLIVVLDKESNLALTIFFLSDLLELANSDQELSHVTQEFKKSNVDFLQLYIRFPFDFTVESTPDLARLILMANWSTPVGAFGMNESQKVIYYRHVFEVMGDEPSVDMVMETVNAMAFFAQSRIDSLKTIASGEMSLYTYIKDLERLNTKAEEFPGYDL